METLLVIEIILYSLKSYLNYLKTQFEPGADLEAADQFYFI